MKSKKSHNKNVNRMYKRNKEVLLLGVLQKANERGDIITHRYQLIHLIPPIHKRMFYYYFKKLKNKRLIENTTSWVLTPAGMNYLSQFLGYPVGEERTVRSHNLTFSFKILHRPDDKKFKKYDFKSSKLNNWNVLQQQKRWDATTSLKFTQNNLFIHISEVYTSEAKESVFLAYKKCLLVIELLYKEFQGLRLVCTTMVNVVTQHHAIKSRTVAKFLTGLSQKFNIHYKSDRLEIDKSKGYPEIELVSPEYAEEDYSLLINLFEDTIRGKFKHLEMSEKVKLLEEKVNKWDNFILAFSPSLINVPNN